MKPARLVLVLLIMLVASTAMARIWTDKFGKTVNAKFVRYFDGNVVLQQGVKVIKISFDELSEKDQDYLRELLEKKGQADLLPPKEEEKIASGEVRLSEAGPKRTWTDVDGREIEAQLLGINGDEVLLLFKEKEVAVPLERLSPKDREYVEKEKEKARREPKPFEEANPPRPPVASPPAMPSPRIPSRPNFPSPPNISPPSIPRPTMPTPSIPRHEFPRPSIPETPQFPRTQPSFPSTPRPEMPRHSFPTPGRRNNSDPLDNQSDAYKGLFNTAPPANGPQAQLSGAGYWVGVIIGYFIMLVIGSVVGALFLMITCAIFNAFAGGARSRNGVPQPNFGQAIGICFSVSLLQMIIGIVSNLLLYATGNNPVLGILCFLAMLVVPFIAYVSFISSTLPTSTGKAVLIAIMQYVLLVGLVIFMVIILFAIGMSAGGLAR